MFPNLSRIGELILKFEERFPGSALPVCKSPDHDPDIKVGYKVFESNNNQHMYWLYCGICKGKSLESVSKKALSEDPLANAVGLDSLKNR